MPGPLLSAEDALWQAELAAESIGWQPLSEGAYLHLGDPGALEAGHVVIEVVGMPDVAMAGWNVLLLA